MCSVKKTLKISLLYDYLLTYLHLLFSGRFRKQSNPAFGQPQGPHRLPPPGPAPAPSSTAENLTREIFSETVNRPSRRGSMTSLHQPKETTADVLPPERDSEYDQAVSKGMVANNQDRGSATVANRNDSYKKAKGGGNMRNYNSLPRLGKDRQRAAPISQQASMNDDPETRSLGEQRAAQRQRRGGQKGNDNCQMM